MDAGQAFLPVETTATIFMAEVRRLRSANANPASPLQLMRGKLTRKGSG